MNELIPVSGILFVAAITPGPNNILVLGAAINGGWRVSLPVVAGIVSGALALFVLVGVGLDLTLKRLPFVFTAFSMGASLYLVWMGWQLIGSAETGHRKAEAISPLGAAFFQLINPKSWVIMSVAASSAGQSRMWEIAAIMVLVFGTCLSVWAFAGVYLGSLVQNRALEQRFNWIMGACLMLFASVIVANRLI